MSTVLIHLALSFIVYSQLLPSIYLACIRLHFGQEPLAVTIQGIIIEDDVCLPHPPVSRSQPLEASFDCELFVCNATSSDGSILPISQDATFAVPLVISEPTDSWLMETNILNDLTLFDADVTFLNSTTNIIDFTSKEDSVFDFHSSSDKIYILDS
ncbi:hypothetical protein AX14_002552 [Amanita brunnescens Koide BX004]|nr:hypothetical protein AX14_002552 [Amanita brunnescens Koide BX004]